MQTLRHYLALSLLLAPLPVLAAGESLPLTLAVVPFFVGGAVAGGFGVKPYWSVPAFLLNVILVALCISLLPGTQGAFMAGVIYGVLGGLFPFSVSYWISRRVCTRRGQDAV